MTAQAFLALCLDVGLGMVLLSILLGVMRAWRGPTMADRVVALDMMTASVIAFCGLSAVRVGSDAYLDIAVVLALVGFVAVIALARYAGRQVRRGRDD